MIMRGRCVRTEYDARRQLDALLADGRFLFWFLIIV